MIRKLNGMIQFAADQIVYLDSLKPYKGRQWKSRSRDMESIKGKIRLDLNIIQSNNKCAYCGLDLRETSGPEIEHIAPKGEKPDGTVLYPQFMYEPYNLVFACHRCNCDNKKVYDSIQTVDDDYTQCEFKIIHPYFDEPSDHLDWVDNRTKILIIGKSPKGIETIKLFKLDEEQHSIARAKIKRYQELLLTKRENRIVEDVLNYTGNN